MYTFVCNLRRRRNVDIDFYGDVDTYVDVDVKI